MKKIFIVLMVGISYFSYSQISKPEKQETIYKVVEIIEARYIFPEVAYSMKNFIVSNLESGKYDSISTAEEFAFQLTNDLQHISKDLHLKIHVDKELSNPENAGTEQNGPDAGWIKNLLIDNNYGVKSKKIMEGNIGYLEIPMFGPLDLCADTLKAAIGYIKNTDALIIDLRECRGSLDENTIPFFCSYFFNEPVHLFDFYTRETNSTKQFWTYAWVPGEKYLEKPIYILTSGRTFSGGEELAYDLKHLERARIVGEPTRGGANPTDYVRVNSHFSISVPYMRSINPVTKTNWEHSGVQPDIAVKPNLAEYTAHVDALKKLYNKTDDKNRRTSLQKTLQKVKDNQPEFRKIEFKLTGFENAREVFVAGSFNSWAAKNTPLKRENNSWVAEVECEPGKVSYKFIVDDRWITDPQNPHSITENGYLNSYLIVK